MVSSSGPPTLSKAAKKFKRSDGTCTSSGQVYSVSLTSIGWARSIQDLSEEDLRAVVHATLHALVSLHGANLVHRDLRLDNILWQAKSKPFLNDLELVAESNQKVPEGVFFRGWDASTLSPNSTYTTTSDLYQLGKIMESFPQDRLSVEGKDLCRQLCGKSIESAQNALAHRWVACPGSCG